MSAHYVEPTARQAEEAHALLFLAETQKALHTQGHIWDLALELDVNYSVHNQRTYRVHATTKAGENITGTEGYYVHPANGTAESTAWSLALSYRAATLKRRQPAPATAPAAPAAARRATA